MKSALVILAIVGVSHFVALLTGLYDTQIVEGSVWIDNVLHVVVGLATAFLWVSIKGSQKTFWSLTLSTLAFVSLIALGWEVAEFLFQKIAPAYAETLKLYSPSVYEASLDIFSNLTGAVLLLCWFMVRRVKAA